MNGAAAVWPIWGHQPAVAMLLQAVASDRVRHAYLFAGPEGVGKTAIALAMARALGCLAPIQPGLPCGECRSCRKIERGVHPDVQTFGLDSQIAAGSKTTGKNTTLTIETIRALTSTAVLRPIESRWRVIIVDDAELMQETAQEALLKTLEEPPPFAVIILLANDAEILLPTIRSRCQLVELALVPRSVIETGLLGRGVEQTRAHEIAGAASGSPGWAIRAVASPKMVGERVEAIERAVTWVRASQFERVATAFRLGDSFTKRRLIVYRDMEVVLGVWRDALLLKTGLPDAVTFPVVASELSDSVDRWQLRSIHAALRSVRQCIADLEANVRPRLAIESMVLQWPNP